MKYILSDEGIINMRGYIVLTSGIEYGEFEEKNPVCLWNHERGVIIGKWTNLKVENRQLIGEVVFAEGDEFAQQKKNLALQGMLNGASIGHEILEVHYLEINGETTPVVTRCRLLEVSLVDIPANSNTVRVRMNELKAGDIMTLSLATTTNIPTIYKMKKVITALGLPDNANEEAIVQVIETLKAKKVSEITLEEAENKVKDFVKQIAELTQEVAQTKEAAKQAQATSLVDAALAAGKITVPEKENFEKLALADYETTKKILSAKTAYVPVYKQLGVQAANVENRSDWSFQDWQKKDSKGLAALKANDSDSYKRLLNTLPTSKIK